MTAAADGLTKDVGLPPSSNIVAMIDATAVMIPIN
jgi:hypothetical protein